MAADLEVNARHPDFTQRCCRTNISVHLSLAQEVKISCGKRARKIHLGQIFPTWDTSLPAPKVPDKNVQTGDTTLESEIYGSARHPCAASVSKMHLRKVLEYNMHINLTTS